jgi:hypothetical protein
VTADERSDIDPDIDAFTHRRIVAAQVVQQEFGAPLRDGKLVLRTWRDKREAPFYVNKWWMRIATSMSSKDAVYVSIEDEWTYVSYSNGKTPFEWRASTYDIGTSTAHMVEIIRAVAVKYLREMHMVYRSRGGLHDEP